MVDFVGDFRSGSRQKWLLVRKAIVLLAPKCAQLAAGFALAL